MNIYQGITVGNKTKFKKMTDGSTTTVRNATERKALTYSEAVNTKVIESETSAAYRLVRGGDPTLDADWVIVEQQGTISGIKPVLLNQVTAVTTSSAIPVVGLKNFTVLFTSIEAILGSRFYIEVLDPTGDWRVIHDQEVTTNDTWPISWDGAYLSVRVRLYYRADGKYTASLIAR